MNTSTKHPLYTHVYPPCRVDSSNIKTLFIFLSGTNATECGPDWQGWVAYSMQDLPITVFNPRQAGINLNADKHVQSELIDWEMDCIHTAQLLIFYFYPGTVSTTSLLMLALYLRSKKSLIVCCPNGYWKKEEVQLLCRRGRITLLETSQELEKAIREVAKNLLSMN